MKGRKVYGGSKGGECVFCGGHSYQKNDQQAPVCKDHKDCRIGDIKCVCGEWLDVRESKWGVFFTCMNCGTVSLSKAKNIAPEAFNARIAEKKKASPLPEATKYNPRKKSFTPKKKKLDFTAFEKGDVHITSDDIDLYFS